MRCADHRGQARDVALQLNLKLVLQAQGLQVAPERETPTAQQALIIEKTQMPHASVVMVGELETHLKRPRLPL